MQSRDDLSAKIHKSGDRGDESDDRDWVSHIGDITYLNTDNKYKNNVCFDVYDKYEQPKVDAFLNPSEIEIKALQRAL